MSTDPIAHLLDVCQRVAKASESSYDTDYVLPDLIVEMRAAMDAAQAEWRRLQRDGLIPMPRAEGGSITVSWLTEEQLTIARRAHERVRDIALELQRETDDPPHNPERTEIP